MTRRISSAALSFHQREFQINSPLEGESMKPSVLCEG